MRSILTKIKEFELEDQKGNGEVFSQIFKKQRLRLNMTLERASNGICSISYLSKLENNLIENVEEDYMRRLCERVDLNYSEIKQSKNVENLDLLVLSYLSGNYKDIENYYEQLSDSSESVKADIVRAFYLLINKRFEMLKEVLLLIEKVKGSFHSIEAYLFIILNIEFSLAINKSSVIIETYQELSKMNCRYKYISWLIIYEGLRIAYLEKDYIDFNYYYSKIIVIDDISFPIDVIILARTMKVELEIDGGFNTEISDNFITSNLENVNNNNLYQYLKLLIFFRKGMYLEVINFLKINSLVSNPHYLGLYSECCYRIKKEDEYDNIKRIYNLLEFSNYEIHDKLFIGYVILKINKASYDELDDYINNKIIKVEEEYRNRLYNDIIFYDYLNIMSKRTKYKDTAMFLIRHLQKKNNRTGY